MFAEVIVPGKKEKRTRYCRLQEVGLVMCARTVGLYATGLCVFRRPLGIFVSLNSCTVLLYQQGTRYHTSYRTIFVI